MCVSLSFSSVFNLFVVVRENKGCRVVYKRGVSEGNAKERKKEQKKLMS